MSRTRRAGSLVTAGAVAVAALASLAGPALAKDRGSERVPNAKPAKMPSLPKGGLRLKTQRHAPDGSGAPAGGRRSLGLPAARRSIHAPRMSPGGRPNVSASWIGLELPWKSISSGYTSAAPAVGRLLYLMPNGKENYCSASVVAVNVIVTAAHCVANGTTGAENTRFRFYPKVNGTAPHGYFEGKVNGDSYWAEWNTNPYRCSSGGPAGTCHGFYAMDYAFITLKPNASGRNVGYYTGWYGLWANAPAGTMWHLGYPGEGSWINNVNTPYHCQANPQRWTKYAYLNKYDVGMSCYNTGGSSGGPWLMTSNGAGYVASVQSHMGKVYWQSSNCQVEGCARYGTTFFGPYFDNDTLRLLNIAKAK